MNSRFGEFCRIFVQVFGEFFDQILGQIFGQVFDNIFGRDFDQGLWPPRIQCAVLLGRRNTVYSTTGTGENAIYYLLFEIQKIPNSILGTI